MHHDVIRQTGSVDGVGKPMAEAVVIEGATIGFGEQADRNDANITPPLVFAAGSEFCGKIAVLANPEFGARLFLHHVNEPVFPIGSCHAGYCAAALASEFGKQVRRALTAACAAPSLVRADHRL